MPPVIRKLKRLSGLIYSDSSGRVKSKLPAVLVDHSATMPDLSSQESPRQLNSQPRATAPNRLSLSQMSQLAATQRTQKVSMGRGGPKILRVSTEAVDDYPAVKAY